VTGKGNLDEDDIKTMEKCSNIDLYDFNLTKEQVYDLYKKSAILLNPTKWDSGSLVTLEAIKYGCLIIGNGIYAIKEMVPKTSLKYLTSPRYKYWNDDNTINLQVVYNQQQTIDNGEIDTAEVEFITKHLIELNSKRDTLCQDCRESYKLSRNKDFSSKEIANQWREIFEVALR
jgi:glycosyltransferase involved in cell wall biosynthesis